MENRICIVCSKEFKPIQEGHKSCSRACRTRWSAINSGRRKMLDLPSGTVGAISEIKIATFLLEKGYAVFRALSPACFCDLIAVKNDKVLRIEARTGYIGKSKKPHFPRTSHGNIDVFAVFFAEQEKIMFFDEKGMDEINML